MIECFKCCGGSPHSGHHHLCRNYAGAPGLVGVLDDLHELQRRLTDGEFYKDYDEDLRLLGVFRAALESEARACEQIGRAA